MKLTINIRSLFKIQAKKFCQSLEFQPWMPILRSNLCPHFCIFVFFFIVRFTTAAFDKNFPPSNFERACRILSKKIRCEADRNKVVCTYSNQTFISKLCFQRPCVNEEYLPVTITWKSHVDKVNLDDFLNTLLCQAAGAGKLRNSEVKLLWW